MERFTKFGGLLIWRLGSNLDDSITAGPEGGSFLVEGEGLIAGRMFLQVRQFE
jgi:hypothetical protein